ncbi:MAG: polyphenol oxidase family protein [Candidatus Rokuibacteriota bacterium]
MSLVPHGEPPRFFTFPSLTALGVPHATTTRHCPGVTAWSDAAGPFRPEASAALAGAGLDLGRAAWARQVHGADVVRVATDGGFAGPADVLVSTVPDAAPAIFTADCLAIVAYDPEARALAVGHVGWRGTVRGAAPAVVAGLVTLGARPERVRVAIAPSIGPCCYEIDEPVAAELQRAYPSLWEGWVTAGRPGHWRLDLWRANEELLARAGVPSLQIDNARVCTACHTDLFYSYRKGNRGRLVTLAALPI